LEYRDHSCRGGQDYEQHWSDNPYAQRNLHSLHKPPTTARCSHPVRSWLSRVASRRRAAYYHARCHATHESVTSTGRVPITSPDMKARPGAMESGREQVKVWSIRTRTYDRRTLASSSRAIGQIDLVGSHMSPQKPSPYRSATPNRHGTERSPRAPTRKRTRHPARPESGPAYGPLPADLSYPLMGWTLCGSPESH
jgi:hypothetical protein